MGNYFVEIVFYIEEKRNLKIKVVFLARSLDVLRL